jgi:hypothetical protein
VTSPKAPDGSGDGEPPTPAHPDSSRADAPAEPARQPAEPAEQPPGSEVSATPEPGEDPEPDEEPRPAPGIRWSDGDQAAPADGDATPPTGFHMPPAPGEVVPDRTTATAPTPPPGTAWPHPGYGQGAPPTWPQTAPGRDPASPPRDPARRRRLRRIVLLVVLALVVVAVVVVLLLAFLVGPRFARYDVLDHVAVERGVTDVVTRDWHRQIADVSCPDGERVRPGVAFTCRATVDGRPAQVPVDVVDENGTYEVGQPR